MSYRSISTVSIVMNTAYSRRTFAPCAWATCGLSRSSFRAFTLRITSKGGTVRPCLALLLRDRGEIFQRAGAAPASSIEKRGLTLKMVKTHLTQLIHKTYSARLLHRNGLVKKKKKKKKWMFSRNVRQL